MLPPSLEIDCADVAEHLSDLLDGELDPHDAVRLAVHLSRCAPCAATAAELAATVQALHRVRRPPAAAAGGAGTG